MSRLFIFLALLLALATIGPDFHIASEEELVERGGGAMMTLMRLPLAWEVAS